MMPPENASESAGAPPDTDHVADRYGVAGQFESYAQKHRAATLGIWAFLSSEIMLFGAMFLGYTVYRIFYGPTFHQISKHMHLWMGTANTAILLTSSLTMALAVHCAKQRQLGRCRVLLAATLVLGLVFLGIKGWEWHLEFSEHLLPIPSRPFDFDGANVGAAKLFMGFYFVMTGVHFVHLSIGTFLVVTQLAMVSTGIITLDDPDKIEITGLYWHLVDIIWVFLYPLFYLAGP